LNPIENEGKSKCSGVSTPIALGSFGDPRADANWNVSADLDGDGTYETNFTKASTGSLSSVSFIYPYAGNCTASVKVADKDGAGSIIATFTVTAVGDTITSTIPRPSRSSGRTSTLPARQHALSGMRRSSARRGTRRPYLPSPPAT